MESTLRKRSDRRAQVKSPLVYLIFGGVFAVLFAVIFVLVIFNNSDTLMDFWWPWLVAAAFGGIVVSLMVSRLFLLSSSPSLKEERIMVILLFLLLFILQVVLGWMLRTDPAQSPAYGHVYSYAQQFALYNTKADNYFLYNPADSGLYVVLCAFFSVLRMFGVTNFLMPSIVLNVIVMDIALVLLYLSARYLFGEKRAIFVLVICFFTLPFYLYAPVISSETLALPFPIAAVYQWLHARKHWRAGKKGEAVRRFLWLSGLLALGAILRTAVLIVWVAIVLDLLILLTGKGRVRLAFGGLALVAVIAVAGGWFVRYGRILPRYDRSEGVPVTQQIMAGLKGYGVSNNEDLTNTLAQDKAQRSGYVAGEISTRLSDMGFLGVITHMGDKLTYTFEDGTYNGAIALDGGAVSPGVLQQYVTYYGNRFTAVAYFSYAFQAALLFWNAVAAFKALARKNVALTFVRVALFGLVLFLMIFETSPRSLLVFLPLLLLCAQEAAPIAVAPRKSAKKEAVPVPGDLPPGEAQDGAVTADTAAEMLHGFTEQNREGQQAENLAVGMRPMPAQPPAGSSTLLDELMKQEKTTGENTALAEEGGQRPVPETQVSSLGGSVSDLVNGEEAFGQAETVGPAAVSGNSYSIFKTEAAQPEGNRVPQATGMPTAATERPEPVKSPARAANFDNTVWAQAVVGDKEPMPVTEEAAVLQTPSYFRDTVPLQAAPDNARHAPTVGGGWFAEAGSEAQEKPQVQDLFAAPEDEAGKENP